jgi:hypothetical protein
VINFDDIKYDKDRHLHRRILANRRSLAANKKNTNWQQEIRGFLTRVSPHFRNGSVCSNYWAVAVEFSRNVLETAKQLPNWCIVLVSDGQEQIPPKLADNIFILNGIIQYELAQISAFYKESLLLPKGLYSVQKNLGYLWAIFHGATMVWDFDSVNELIVNQSVLSIPLNETVEVFTIPNHNSTLFNPYSVFASNFERICSRGYPFRSFKVSYLNSFFLLKLHPHTLHNVYSLYFRIH